MQLRLVVEAPGRDPAHVNVEMDPGTPAQRLLEELAIHLGRPPGEYRAAQSERTGAWLAGDEAVGEAGLCDGDCLMLAREPAPDADGHDERALVELVVVGGPASGARIPLAAGTHVVGRGPGVDVALADRSMSRRHISVDVAETGVTVTDAGSTNGTFVDGRPVEGPRAVGNGDVLEAGRTLLSFAPCRVGASSALVDASGQVAFNRPPRVTARPDEAPIELPAPPAADAPARISLGPMLLPVAMGVGMFALTGSPLMLMISALTPALAVWSHVEGRRTGRRSRGEAARRFEEALAAGERALVERRTDERDRRRAAAPDAADLRERAEALRADLWERRPGDEDFLLLRVGTADQQAQATAKLQPGGDDELREDAERRLRDGALLPAVPVAVPLADGFCGLAGDASAVASLARWLVAQAAVLHSPAELSIAAAIAPDRVPEWEWLKWLPHVPRTAMAGDDVAANDLLETLAGDPAGPTLAILDGELRLDRSLVDRLVDREVPVLWLGRDPRQLPGACTHVVALDGERAALQLLSVRDGTTVDDVAADGVPLPYVEALARRLAPVRDAAARRQSGGVPTRVSLLDLLDLPDPGEAALEARWQHSDLRLEAPIGMAGDGPFTLAVGGVEGMRMLVAGMPGAGKSELLQTFIASLAASHPPDRVTFLLVDYKGGAAFSDCVALPHTVGLLTDLDPHLAERCRISLLAELRRREGLLKEAGARSLRELARRDPGRTPPALVIVIDEFATLVREVPAFVDTAVDVAQRGRSLGIHLVLATQRPRGAVSDAIRANTNFRIAMRVSDAGESRDVIEAPDAASIPAHLPGRAIVLSGRTASGAPRLEEVQTAFAGGRSSGILGGRAAISISELRFGGAPPARERVLSTVGGGALTDLQALVAAADRAARRLDLPAPPAPWLPPLPGRLELDELPAPPPGQAMLGLADEPDRQRQEPRYLDLAREGSLIAYGASGAGKTGLLRTIAASLAVGCSPAELHIYGMDFASRALQPIEALPHCGSVVTGDDEERVQRLLALLRSALADRRARLSAGETLDGLPRIVLLLDGYAAFAAAFERVQFGEATQAISQVAAEGRPLGIGVVATADRRADVPGALAGVAQGRIVLRLADEDEYATLGVPREAAAGAAPPPGRGWLRDGTELQLAHVGDERLASLGAELRRRWPGSAAPAIGRMPTRLGRDRLPMPPRRWTALIGVEHDSLAAAALDLSYGSALVAGPRRAGRSTALATIAHSLARGPSELPLHLLAPRRTPLTDRDGWATIAAGAEACRSAAVELAAQRGPFAVLVDDAEELGEGVPALDELLRRGRDEEIRLVAAAENRALQRLFGGWLRDLRSEGRGVLLHPDPDADGELLGVRLPRNAPAGMSEPGRGYLVADGVARLIQTAGDAP